MYFNQKLHRILMTKIFKNCFGPLDLRWGQHLARNEQKLAIIGLKTKQFHDPFIWYVTCMITYNP